MTDQPDTLAMLQTALGGDVLCNNTTGRYLSDHIEELIAARLAASTIDPPEDTPANRQAISEDPGGTLAIMQRMQKTIQKLMAERISGQAEAIRIVKAAVIEQAASIGDKYYDMDTDGTAGDEIRATLTDL